MVFIPSVETQGGRKEKVERIGPQIHTSPRLKMDWVLSSLLNVQLDFEVHCFFNLCQLTGSQKEITFGSSFIFAASAKNFCLSIYLKNVYLLPSIDIIVTLKPLMFPIFGLSWALHLLGFFSLENCYPFLFLCMLSKL